MDLKIKDVAMILNVSESTIRKWLQDKVIPAYRVNDQFRFCLEEIEDWVMSCRMESKNFSARKESLARDSIQKAIEKAGTRQFSLYRAIHHGEVFTSIEGSTKEEIIRNTVEEISSKTKVDGAVLSDFLLDRERLMPTALNHSFAVPHTRDFLLKGPFDLITVVYPQSPIEYGALDRKPVEVLFFLFACEDKRHLHLLAKLAHLISEEKNRDFLMTKPDKAKLLSYVKKFESKIPNFAKT